MLGRNQSKLIFTFGWMRVSHASTSLTRSRWKVPDNVYRKDWGLKAIPTLIRYQRVNGEVTATGRLVETEVSDEEKLLRFVRE
jgi:hypothetical protein